MNARRLTLSVVLLLVGLLAASPGGVVSPSRQQKPKDNGSTIVYGTKTGAKYHNAGCSSLRKSSIAMTLRGAVAAGLGPCKNCNPPVLANLASAALPAERTAPAPRPGASSRQKSAQDNGGTIVYRTKTGAKYHRAGCSSLRKSSIAVTLRDAVAAGLGPCKICKPPVFTTSQPPKTTPVSLLYEGQDETLPILR